MQAHSAPPVGEVTPRDAWQILSGDDRAVLVDVRSRAEWTFVGGPDLSALGREAVRLEWASWPGMTPEPGFAGALLDGFAAPPSRILFVCRSGARSMAAAQAVAEEAAARGRPVACVNVAEGFEGDLDDRGRRGAVNGWKARGLAWRQS
jgi:rhodanese-related sulfurtransferase